jgi:signal peptidase II
MTDQSTGPVTESRGAVGRPAGADRPARASVSAWVVLALVGLVGLAVDLATKSLAFERVAGVPVVIEREQVLSLMADDPRSIGRLIPPHDPVQALPGLLEFTLVLNPGAVFGMGPGQRWFFKLFTLVAIGFSLWMFWAWMRRSDRLAQAAIGLLLAGGLGNFYDRWTFGCVRDFLHPLPGWQWPGGLAPFGSREVWPYVSNVADAWLIVGIAVLFVFLWRHDGRRVSSTPPAPAQPEAPASGSR